jgi:hypothetical protein
MNVHGQQQYKWDLEHVPHADPMYPVLKEMRDMGLPPAVLYHAACLISGKQNKARARAILILQPPENVLVARP